SAWRSSSISGSRPGFAEATDAPAAAVPLVLALPGHLPVASASFFTVKQKRTRLREAGSSAFAARLVDRCHSFTAAVVGEHVQAQRRAGGGREEPIQTGSGAASQRIDGVVILDGRSVELDQSVGAGARPIDVVDAHGVGIAAGPLGHDGEEGIDIDGVL